MAEQEVITMLTDAELFLEEKDFRQAKGKLISARLKVKFGEYPTAFKKKWLKKIQTDMDLTTKTEEAHKETVKAIRDRRAQDLIEDDVRQLKERLREQKARLQEQYEIFIRRGEFKDALVVLNRMQMLDPEDKSIRNKIHDVVLKELKKRAGKAVKERRLQEQYQYLETREAMIPWYPIFVYPPNWAELTEKRLRGQATAAITDSAADRKVRSKLEETIGI